MRHGATTRNHIFAGLALAIALAVPAVVWLRLHWIVAALLGINAASFAWYGIDKWKARHGRRRIPENAFHFLCFVGGSPGAFLGQRVFRHKTRKGSFQRVFWLLVILQAIIVVGAIWWARFRS